MTLAIMASQAGGKALQAVLRGLWPTRRELFQSVALLLDSGFRVYGKANIVQLAWVGCLEVFFDWVRCEPAGGCDAVRGNIRLINLY